MADLAVVGGRESYRRAAVEALEQALDLARAQGFSSVFIAADVDGTTSLWTRITGAPDRVQVLGKLRLLEHDLINQLGEERSS